MVLHIHVKKLKNLITFEIDKIDLKLRMEMCYLSKRQQTD